MSTAENIPAKESKLAFCHSFIDTYVHVSRRENGHTGAVLAEFMKELREKKTDQTDLAEYAGILLQELNSLDADTKDLATEDREKRAIEGLLVKLALLLEEAEGQSESERVVLAAQGEFQEAFRGLLE